MSNSKILTSEEVGEIEARYKLAAKLFPYKQVNDSLDDIPVLCSTVRQLLEENERLRKLVRHMQFPRGG